MRVVVDASVIVEIVLAGGSLGPLATHELAAPPLALSEATSTLCEMAWRGEIPREKMPEALGYLRALRLVVSRPADLSERACEIASTLGWAKTYDAEYVALAVEDALPLVTLDGRLARGVAHLVRVVGPLDLGR